MTIDAIEAFSPPSHPSSHFSQQRHFYVAVDRLQFKMETLVGLLDVAGRRPSLPMIVCCSSRDELDAVCSAVSNLQYISLASLNSDLAQADRALILETFRQTTLRWSQKLSSLSDDKCEVEEDGEKSHMIVVTDACLPLLASGESPLSAHVLINYELPTKKETYMRRMTTCSASDAILINMVVGGEVVTLKSIEESSGLVIAEMPINSNPSTLPSVFYTTAEVGKRPYCRFLKFYENVYYDGTSEDNTEGLPVVSSFDA